MCFYIASFPLYSLFCTVINAVSYSEGKRAWHNRELCEVYRSPGLLRAVKYRRVRWAGRVDRVKREGMHA
jgi:hypothetical protein